MRHPFIGWGISYYLAAWIVLTAAHVTVLEVIYHPGLAISILDAVIFNVLQGSFGFGLWWAIQSLNPNYQGAVGTVIALALIAVVGALTANFVSESFLYQFYLEDSADLAYFLNTRLWKLLIGSSYLSIIILVYYLLKHNYSLNQKTENETKLQELLRQSELDMLKFQINPHFIFNSLNSVSALTLTQPDRAREMIIKLSEFLRGSLGNDRQDIHTLRDELAQMNRYLDIEKIRFGDRLTVIQEVDDTMLDKQVPAMILQPLYENAIKFGVYEQLDSVSIHTKVSMEVDRLVIKVLNNYDSQNASHKGRGIGLNNVRSRLELIYGISDLVTIERGKHKFCVRLDIPQ